VAKYTALGVLAVGLALLTMMIIVEDEPGALPLLLVLLGSIGFFVARRRERAAARGSDTTPEINAPRASAHAPSSRH
jgi:hypothetical protein